MTETLVDSRGALIEFHAVPPQRTPGQPATNQPASRAAAIDWQIVFDAVGWPRNRFTPATPEWTPLVDTDTRAAWTGTLPELGATPLRLEAGSFGGRLVFVQTVGPWTKASREAPPESKSFGQRIPDLFLAFLILSLIVGSSLLARRNVVLGRGDQQGGWRVAAALAALSSAAGPSPRITCPTIPSSRTRSSTRSAGRCCRPASCGSPISASSRGSGATGRPASSRGAGCCRAPSAIRWSAATC